MAPSLRIFQTPQQKVHLRIEPAFFWLVFMLLSGWSFSVTAQCTMPSLDSSMIGFYQFSGNANDSSTLTPINNGTLNNGVLFQPSFDDSSVYFDGVNDYIELNTNFDLNGDYSFSCWIKPGDFGNYSFFSMRNQCNSSARGWNRGLISLSDSTSGNPLYGSLHPPSFPVPNQLTYSLARCHSNCGGWSNAYSYTTPGTSIDTTCYTHVVLTVENNDDNNLREVNFYVNGVSVDDTLHWIPNGNNLSNTVDPFSNTLNNGYDTFFGHNHNNQNFTSNIYPFLGNLDHVRIYNRVIDQCEVTLLYEEFISLPDSIIFTNQQYCSGDSIDITLNNVNTNHVVSWYFNGVFQDSVTTLSTQLIGPDTIFVEAIVSLEPNGVSMCISDTFNTEIIVLKSDSILHFYTICDGDSVIVGNQVYNTTGVYTQAFINNVGCDSLMITDLVVLPELDTLLNIALCPGNSYQVGNNVYTNSGNYIDTLTNVFGCDSVVSLQLTVASALFTSQNIHLCQGETITVGNSVYTQPGNYVDSLTANLGCDSIVFTDISISPTHFSAFDTSICRGDSVIVNGIVYKTEGLYTLSLSNRFGCDSIIELDLVVNDPEIVNSFYSICDGDSVVVQFNSYTQEGIYYDTIQVPDACDSILVSHISQYTSNEYQDSVYICEGDEFNINGHTYTQEGIYMDTISTIKGCDSIVTTFLYWIADPSVSLSVGEFCINEKPYISIDGNPGINYRWSTGEIMPQISADIGNWYFLEYAGCKGTYRDSIFVDFDQACHCSFFIPNTFTPNTDGINEGFKPKFDCLLEEYEFVIYNRWGYEVFKTNDPDEAWWGKFGSTAANVQIGTYAWRLIIKPQKSVETSVWGMVNLLR